MVSRLEFSTRPSLNRPPARLPPPAPDHALHRAQQALPAAARIERHQGRQARKGVGLVVRRTGQRGQRARRVPPQKRLGGAVPAGQARRGQRAGQRGQQGGSAPVQRWGKREGWGAACAWGRARLMGPPRPCPARPPAAPTCSHQSQAQRRQTGPLHSGSSPGRQPPRGCTAAVAGARVLRGDTQLRHQPLPGLVRAASPSS